MWAVECGELGKCEISVCCRSGIVSVIAIAASVVVVVVIWVVFVEKVIIVEEVWGESGEGTRLVVVVVGMRAKWQRTQACQCTE